MLRNTKRVSKAADTGDLGRRGSKRRLSPWLAVDSLLWAIMYLVSLWQRFDFEKDRTLTALERPEFIAVLGFSIFMAAVTGYSAGVYRGRFVPGSLLEAAWLTITLVGTSVLMFLAVMVFFEPGNFPRGLPVVAGAFTVLAALVSRSLVRTKEVFRQQEPSNSERVIVLGAGSGGRLLVRQLRQSRVSAYYPVAILDDDFTKHEMVIEGVPVKGTARDIERVARDNEVSTLIIAVPSLSGESIAMIRDRAEAAGMNVLILPPIDTMMTGRRAVDELREINVNDLLGRKPARLNQTQIADYIRGKRVLVTGAGGSIGSELCRQLTRFRPGELLMLDRDETGLQTTQLSIQNQSLLDGDDTILASIRDRDAIRSIFAKRRPEIVFHAAALKHMPLLENHAMEAFKTNVLGTKNLIEAAIESGVETFINISTDKAANPSNVLGYSKRTAERLTAEAATRSSFTKFVSVRFGNVLGSRGSVLTVFEKQISEGNPITVTDPEVTRFFMTIPEACQLVLQAAAVGETGQTLVLDMGEPVRITDVARTLIEQSGKKLEIVYTGLRGNEKLHEDLFDESEIVSKSPGHESLSVVRVPAWALGTEQESKVRTDVEAVELMRHAACGLDIEESGHRQPTVKGD